MNLALTGVTVLDATRLLPGAVCTMFLADLGARIIKIEDTTLGDYARWTPPLLDGLGAFFRASNRNKESIMLNLKDARGQAILHRLVAQADVLIEGFRPGVTARLGMDAPTLHILNPRLIYCSLSGWGQTGAYAAMSGHDLNYVALSGLLGSMATPQVLGGQIADIGGAYAAALGIVSALYQRTQTHSGTTLDIALFESALPFSMYQWVESLTAGTTGGSGSLTGGMAFYRVYASSDGLPMAFAPIEPQFWRNFCAAVAHPEWLPLHTQPDQQVFLTEQLTQLFATRTAQAWYTLLADADCCWTLVTPPQHLLDDPQVRDRGIASISAAGVPILRTPIRMGEAPAMVPAPQWGEHTHAVLAAAGYSLEEIAALDAAHVTQH